MGCELPPVLFEVMPPSAGMVPDTEMPNDEFGDSGNENPPPGVELVSVLTAAVIDPDAENGAPPG